MKLSHWYSTYINQLILWSPDTTLFNSYPNYMWIINKKLLIKLSAYLLCVKQISVLHTKGSICLIIYQTYECTIIEQRYSKF